jgi:uncharacterized protein YneF (UPF0154 family)
MRAQPQLIYGLLLLARPRLPRHLPALCLVLASSALPQQARAQSAATGSWRAGATAVEVAVESWGGDCGPRPQSMKTPGGGLVEVEQKDQVLLLHGRDQDIRSDACWSRNPAMKRTMASYAGGVWTARCRTADDDPRAEQGTYTLKLVSPDSLLYQDVSHFDWSLNTSKCVATFTTAQTLTRAQPSKAEAAKAARTPPQRIETPVTPPPLAAVTPTAVTPPSNEERACTPGAAAHLALRPRRADIEVGQRFCFRARVTDAADCALRDPPIEWTLIHSKALRGTLNGACFTAASTAAEAQGDFKIAARSGALNDSVSVTVRPIDLSSVIAKRMEANRLSGFDENAEVATSTPKAVARIATHTSTEAAPSGARRTIVLALGVLAILLAVIGWFFSRRAQPAAISGNPPSTPSSIPPLPAIMSQPPSLPNLAQPAEVATVSESAAPGSSAEKPWICPNCRVGYPAQQVTCPKDGTRLMPYAEFAQQSKRHDEEHAKRCPSCGRTFPASAGFCGSDGTGLVDA